MLLGALLAFGCFAVIAAAVFVVVEIEAVWVRWSRRRRVREARRARVQEGLAAVVLCETRGRVDELALARASRASRPPPIGEGVAAGD